MKISVETNINAPRSRVFARAIDLANWDKVISAIESVEILTPGPVIVGTRFIETRKMFGQSAQEEMTVAELEIDKKIVFTAHSHGTNYRSEHLFEDSGNGTRMTFCFEGQPISPVARLMAPVGWFLCGSLRKMLVQDLNDLKSAIETDT